MERKLSQKAAKLRHRFIFSRDSQGRHRASTMISAGATSTPNSRPRSSTTPVSSNPSGSSWDNTDPSRYYNFTDEPGFFRPASPFIDRQEIEEDLEDEMKHACAMLVHSIERGLPMWPSLETDVRPNTGIGCVDKASVPGAQSEYQYQGTLVLSRGSDHDINVPPCKDMHDSGVAFSNGSSAKLNNTARNSLNYAGVFAGAGRFYRKRPPPDHPSADRGRARGRSFATDVTSAQSRSRSRSAGPALFPYSPPQVDAHWIHADTLLNTETLSSNAHLEQDTLLGTERITWLRASLDIHRLRENEHDHDPDQKIEQTPSHHHIPTTTSLTDPQPRRFYSTRRLPSEKIFHPKEWAYDLPSSRNSSLLEISSVRSLSFDEKRHISVHDWALRGSRGSSPELHEDDDGSHRLEAVDTVVESGTQPRHRRKRASQLLRKLVGLRRREGEFGLGQRGRVVAVAV